MGELAARAGAFEGEDGNSPAVPPPTILAPALMFRLNDIGNQQEIVTAQAYMAEKLKMKIVA